MKEKPQQAMPGGARTPAMPDEAARREAVEVFRRSEEKFRGLFNASHTAIFVADCETGIIVDANIAAERLIRLSRGEIIGMHQSRLHPPGQADYYREMFGRHIRKGRAADFEAEVIRKDGTRVPVFISSSLAEVGGRAVNQGLFHDMTEQKRAEEALQRERDFANSLVETAQTIVLVLDMDGRIVRFNRFARELTGYTEEEVLGQRWVDMFIRPGERIDVSKVFGSVASGQQARGVENTILARDGREILVRWFSSLIADPQGRAANVLSIGHDITEIRQRDDQLGQAAKMEAMGRLVGGIAHDFNNMLAVVQGYSDLLLQSLPADCPEIEDVRQIRNAAARAAELTRQLLAFGRKQIARPRVLDLNALVANMTAMLRSSLGERVRVRMAPQERIWPIKADPSQIEEVVLNLALNAGDAMAGGGEMDIETANVRLAGPINHEHGRVPAGEYVLLTVRDTGEGMSPEVRRRLFEPFFTTNAPGKGSGMGLATCYGIVTQSGGCILVDSRPGKGSTFRVYLPRSDEPLPPPETSLPEEVAAEELPGGHETILVVEDMPDVRQIVVRVLRQCGYAVLDAPDARQAIPLGEHYEGDIDLLLTDVVMPNMGGEDLAERLLGVRPKMKVLFVSGYAGPVSGHKGRLRGGENVLVKPFTPAQLASAVRDALDGRSRRARKTRHK